MLKRSDNMKGHREKVPITHQTVINVPKPKKSLFRWLKAHNRFQFLQLDTLDRTYVSKAKTVRSSNLISFTSTEPSEDSFDVEIPSFPGSPRSVGSIKLTPLDNIDNVVHFLHHDDELLLAAETGDIERIEQLIMKGVNIQQRDQLERNALHYAVCSGNRQAVLLLLQGGIDPNVKSNVGMTPLSLCLMRRPSWKMANMLFDYGAMLLPRNTPMDTGLFLQFVMMCEPTREEEKILRLLVKKGAKVNDPEAPGGRQALHFAAMSNNCRLINILLDLGANASLTNHRHETPIEVAITFRCRQAQKLLEEFEGSHNVASVSQA